MRFPNTYLMHYQKENMLKEIKKKSLLGHASSISRRSNEEQGR